MSLDPFRLVKNLFVDALLWVSGTWVGAPHDPPWEDTNPRGDSAAEGAPAPRAAGDVTG